MQLLIAWIYLTLAVWLTAVILPGFHVRSFGSAIIVAAIFGILNALLGWIFFAVLSIATLGLAYILDFFTRWLINAVLLAITSKISTGLRIDGFRWAIIGALVMSLIGSGLRWVAANAF